jgi:hypothetical protein
MYQLLTSCQLLLGRLQLLADGGRLLPPPLLLSGQLGRLALPVPAQDGRPLQVLQQAARLLLPAPSLRFQALNPLELEYPVTGARWPRIRPNNLIDQNLCGEKH